MTPLVRGLCVAIGPPAISRLIVAVWVNSIKRRSGWALSHISKEGCETAAPAIAHGHADAAVVSVRRVTGVRATVDGTAPAVVGCREPAGYAASVAMRQADCLEALAVRQSCATTRHRPTFRKRVASNKPTSAAITKATPSESGFVVPDVAHYGPSPESYSGQVAPAGGPLVVCGSHGRELGWCSHQIKYTGEQVWMRGKV